MALFLGVLMILTIPKYNVAPSVLNNNDGSFTATTGLIVSGVTSEQIATIMTEQWPETLVWQDVSPGYNYLIHSVKC